MDTKPSTALSNLSLTSSQKQMRSKHTSFEYEVFRSKGVQAGNGTEYTASIPKCRNSCIRKKKKKKINRTEECQNYPCQAICLDKEVCRTHSFCVVDGLRQHGCKPLYPKGLPWASGKLLYYPGQRPKYLGAMRETPQEISRIQQAKKRRKEKAKQKREAALASLRQADDEKLCDVVGTSQEMMLLMKALSLVTQDRKRNRAMISAYTEPELMTVEEENEEGAEGGDIEPNMSDILNSLAEGEQEEEDKEMEA